MITYFFAIKSHLKRIITGGGGCKKLWETGLKKIIGLLYLLIIFAKYLEGAQLHLRGIMFWMKGFSQHDFKENVSTIISMVSA